MNRNRLYLLLLFFILGGYGWLVLNSLQNLQSAFTPCPIKNITGIPCPSCGTTRSIILLSHGRVTEALLLNPLGIIMGSLMVILPVWLLYDLVTKKDTLYRNYQKFENTVKIRWVAFVFVLLILANWIWNIQKGL